MADYVRAAVAAACLLASVYMFRARIRHRLTPVGATMITGMLLPGTSFTLQITAVGAAVDDLIGHPGAALLIRHVLVLGIAFNLQFVVTFVASGTLPLRRVGREALLYLATCTALVVTGVLSEPVRPPVSGDPTVTAFGLPYALIFAGYWGRTFVRFVRLPWRYARWGNDDLTRLGTLMSAVAASAAIPYAVAGLVFATLRAGGLAVSYPVEVAVTMPCMLGGALLSTVGMALPTWGARSRALRPLLRRVGSYRALRDLHPLWWELCRAIPDIALHPPAGPRRDRLALTAVHRRLHRRVIEIEDALLRLRPHRDPDVADRAGVAASARLSGRPLEAVVEASVIVASLDAYTHGRVFQAEPDQPGAGPHAADPDDETAWLCLVALAYRHSPIVAEFRRAPGGAGPLPHAPLPALGPA